MPDKYLYTDGGRTKERESTVVSTGANEAGDIVALDGTGRVDLSVLPVGVGPDTQTATTAEALSAGDFVYITPAGEVAKADSTAAGKEAQGFVLDAANAAAPALVYFEGSNNVLSGLTVGSRYFTSTTAGAATTTPPTASGNVVQYIGRASSATQIRFEPEDGVILT